MKDPSKEPLRERVFEFQGVRALGFWRAVLEVRVLGLVFQGLGFQDPHGSQGFIYLSDGLHSSSVIW